MELIKYLVIDVDGTMTDAGIYYDNKGNELKKFSTKDAAGFFAAKEAGIKIIIMTGRECEATTRRMKELKVDYLFQGIKDKHSFLLEFIKTNNISKKSIGFIGDDLNDFASMLLCGFTACPADSCREIKNISTYISPVSGGKGVVRDVIEEYMRSIGLWDTIITKLYKSGI